MENPYAMQVRDGTITDILASTGAGTGRMSTQLVQTTSNLRVYASGLEARRILRAGGTVVIVVNQFDVEQPWVHRPTRIMRSGDGCQPHRKPHLAEFAAEPVRCYRWSQTLTFGEVLPLARTRTSYLRSSTVNQTKMHSNLSKYLKDCLGVANDEQLILPYNTFLWVLRETNTSGLAA